MPDQRAEDLRALIERSLDDDQALDVQVIPLAGRSTIADYMVIASGRSTRQVASMAQKIAERVKGELKREVRMEGLAAADWVLIDAKDVIVHLFRPEVRSFYALEKMWAFDAAGSPPPPNQRFGGEAADGAPDASPHAEDADA